jgi:serine/threonine protein kinase
MLPAVQQPVPFGKYILLERVSVGGMAEVFKAKSFGVKGFAKIIAIKKILPHLAEDEHFVDMFVAEAKMAVQLNHAHICQIFELGRHGGDHYIAMEYIGGKDLLSLHNHFRRSGTLMPVDLAAYIGACVAEGLDYAHRKRGPDGEPIGIVHRDVSPQNVLVSYDGGVKLIDFGIAKARVRMYEETQAGVLKGKFGYMSPEQVGGAGEVDHRSDVFALGTVVHELLTSHRLFLGETDFGTLEQVRQAKVSPPSLLNPDVPPELDRILLRALARDPDERYPTAGAFAEDLQRFLRARGHGDSAKPMADWMQATFADDIAKEKARHEIYAEIDGAEAERAPAGNPFAGRPDLEDDEEETALWDPVGFEPEPSPPPRIAAVKTRIAEEPEPVAPPLAAAPTPLPVSRAPWAGPSRPAPRRRRRDALIVGASLLVALTGGVVAYLALDPAKRGGGNAGFVLRVTPDDDLSVYLDHQVIAERSPVVKRDLAPGAYVLRIDRPGHQSWHETLTLSSGQIAEIDARLKPVDVPPARLRIETNPPDAELEINGRVYSPAERQGYLEVDGTRPVQLTVRRSGYLPQTQRFTPEPGVSRSLTVALATTRGSLFVDTDPPADVYLDGKLMGRTPRTFDELDVTRLWSVRIEREGYRPLVERVEFGERRYVQLERKLEKY